MMHTSLRFRAITTIALTLALIAPTGAAFAHAEREAHPPDGTGEVPEYRPMIAKPNLVVCAKDSKARIKKITDKKLRADNQKLAKTCKYQNIQDAVNHVKKPGTTIYVLPGVYSEKPYRTPPTCAADLPEDPDGNGPQYAILSYEQQLLCPNAQNLIGIFGDIKPEDDKRECNAPVCDLQIEGTGQKPGDVRITGGFTEDGQFAKANGIRGDRSDGLYLRNFTIELFEFNAVYILETDGFVIDKVVGRWNDEYAFLTFAVDHGLYKNCEGYNNGDSALYPGSASDLNAETDYTQQKRWSVEIHDCKGHHNAAGYSGTAGDSTYVHDNKFYGNQTGVVTDSIYPNHPGLPQNHAWFTSNEIYSNNTNYIQDYVQSGICDKPPAKRGYKPPKGEPKWAGAVCPTIPAPVGAGLVIAGGNWNLVEKNQVWDNWRAGFMLLSVPAAIRNEDDPEKQFDTSHFNKYVKNNVSLDPAGKVDLNGIDFWWDDQGEGNCWQDNLGAHDEIRSNTMYPMGLPDCDSGGSAPVPHNPSKTALIASCATYNRWGTEAERDPPGCDFFDTPPEPQDEGEAFVFQPQPSRTFFDAWLSSW